MSSDLMRAMRHRHGARSRHCPQTRKEEAIFNAGLLARGGRVGQAEAMVFQVECPFCGEPGGVEIEPADFEPGESVLVQDCEVCCRTLDGSGPEGSERRDHGECRARLNSPPSPCYLRTS